MFPPVSVPMPFCTPDAVGSPSPKPCEIASIWPSDPGLRTVSRRTQ